MTSEDGIWIQLYIGTEKSCIVKIRPIPETVYDLQEEVKNKVAIKLSHCDAADLMVFAVGTSVPIRDGTEPLDPGDTVPSVASGTTAGKPPLVVVVGPHRSYAPYLYRL